MPEVALSGATSNRRGLVINDPFATGAGKTAGGGNATVLSEITGGFVVDAPLTTYALATGPVTPVANPTDILTVAPGARNARVTYIRITGTAGTAALWNLSLIKRSTLDTGGTSSAGVLVPHWSVDGAATTMAKIYSANPASLGTAVGSIRDDPLMLAGGTNLGFPIEWTFYNAGRALILPAGSTECLAINAGGVSIPAGGKINITVGLTEDV